MKRLLTILLIPVMGCGQTFLPNDKGTTLKLRPVCQCDELTNDGLDPLPVEPRDPLLVSYYQLRVMVEEAGDAVRGLYSGHVPTAQEDVLIRMQAIRRQAQEVRRLAQNYP